MLRKIFLSILLTSSVQFGFAQVGLGIYPYGTFDNKGFDTINVGNLNVHFAIPILAKSGRGLPFSYSLVYDSSVWYPSGANGTGVWTPATNFGWSGTTTNGLTGYISYSTVSRKCFMETQWVWYSVATSWKYHDAFGKTQNYGGTVQDGTASCATEPLTYTATATDGTGTTMAETFGDATLTRVDGALINAPINVSSGSSGITDSNGNELSLDASGHFTDTTGHVVLTVAGAAPNPMTFTYSDTAGTPRAITVNYRTYTVQTSFGCTETEYAAHSTSLVDNITFPDGSAYHFSYEITPNHSPNVTGRIASVTLPQGGVITYNYTGGSNGIVCADGGAAGLTRTLSADNGSDASTWTYARTPGSGTSRTELTDGLSNHTRYDFVIPSGQSNFYETNRSVYQGAETGTAVLARQTCYNGAVPTCTTSPFTVPIIQIDTWDTFNGIQTRGTTAKYNGFGMQTDAYFYDFASGGSRGGLIKQEHWDYSGSIPGLISQDLIYDGSQNLAGKILFTYDGSTPVASSGVPQHVSVSGPRGNLTGQTAYASSTVSYNQSATFEDTGSVLTSVTPNGTTTFSYDPTFVYVTGVQLPTPSSGVALQTSATFDTSYTGLPLSTTDFNSKMTSVSGYDSMLRPTSIQYPDNGSTSFHYESTTQTGIYQYQNSGTYADIENQLDSYARKSRTALANGQASGENWYQRDVCYDANGNLKFASYAYQAGGFTSSKVCSGSGDTYAYDVLGRVTSVSHSDGTGVSYSYNGRATQLTDENGVRRIIQADGMNRPTVVCEISSSTLEGVSPTSCGTDITGTGFTTTYAYALATGTTTVTQGSQTRTFQTDWLGRTTSITEPESGTTTYSYAYNGTGLAVTRKKPKANQTSRSILTTTTYQYDSLSRQVSASYDDGTPARTLQYDTSNPWGASLQNVKGRLDFQGISNAQSIYSYDVMGRVVAIGQCTPSNCGSSNFATSYAYDWLGNLLTTGDGSGATATYSYSPANEVLSITSSRNDSTDPANLVSSVTNGPFGPLSWKLGNGLNGVRSYDGLGRLSGAWVCNQSSLQFCEGGQRVYGTRVNWSGSRSVYSDDSVMAHEGNYSYDEFNRLTSAAWVADNKDPNLSVDCSPNPVASGGTTACTAHVIPGATGSVVFTYNNGNPWMTVTVDSSGNATTLQGFTGAPVESYAVTASYSGDTNFNAATASTIFTVNSGKSTPNMTVKCSPNPVASGGNTYCQAHVPGGTGSVVFTYNNGSPWMTVNLDSSGNATTNHGFDGAPVGSYPVTASYSGDNNFNPASASTVFIVNSSKSTPNITVSCSPDTIVSGGTTACTANVAGASSGTVTFTYNNGNPWMTVSLSGWGVATTLQGFTGAPNGVYTVTAAYSGDSNFNSSSATTSIDVVAGGSQGFAYVYDRYGNRWQQNVTAGSGPSPQYSFNAATNQIGSGGVTYDAAGNVTNDGFHSYTYDAEGNISSVDNGSTAQYTYDALNRRVQTLIGSYKTEYLFNPEGQRVSIWNGANNTLYRSQYYWGGMPIALYNGQTYFQHQDWLGTERMRTGYNGSVAATFTSLPFGDALATTIGSDVDAYHFAGLDRDIETGTDHAQFRQYTSIQGRWMSPDPYGGSYDFTNPESFNRYAYVLNEPVSWPDPLGLGPVTCIGDFCWTTVWDSTAPVGPCCGGWGWNPGTSGFRPPRQPPRAPKAPPKKPVKGCTTPSLLPHSVGVVTSAEASFGAAAVGASAQGTYGLFASDSGDFGDFLTTSLFSNYGSQIVASNIQQQGTPTVVGGYVGAGDGIVLSNATNIDQTNGPFQTFTLSLPWVSGSFSSSGGIWEVQVTVGPGNVAAYTQSTSNTNVLSNTRSCPHE